MEWRKDMRENILLWNALYPLDRHYRKKYDIGFGSVQHKETDQVLLFFDLFEESVLEHEQKKREEYEKNLLALAQGKIAVKPVKDEAERSFELLASQFFGEDVLREFDD